ncbi:MAG: 50S ribosomal protein L18 [bacterium]
MNKEIVKQIKKQRRAKRARAKIFGTAGRPRLNVFRSNQCLYVQLIDDESGKTLVSAHSKQIKEKGAKTEIALALGKFVGEKAVEANIKKVVFDRGANLYHGRVKAVADGAREAGLEF